MAASIIILLIIALIGAAAFAMHGWFHLVNTIGYVPVPDSALKAVITALELGPNQQLVDLGSGDGRLLRAAKAYEPTISATGYENNPLLVLLAGLRGGGVTYQRQELLKADLRDIDTVYMYLHPKLNQRLEPIFARSLKSGARVVSLHYPLSGRHPTAVITIPGTPARARTLYVYQY